MIIRISAGAPSPEAFERIPILDFTSAELRERYGIELAEFEAATAFELVASLETAGERPTDLAPAKSRLARLLQRRPALLPCFVAYRRLPDGGLLPFMTDGVPGKWSLFFEGDGEMVLVERFDRTFAVTTGRELTGEEPARGLRALLPGVAAPAAPARWSLPRLWPGKARAPGEKG